MSLKRPPNTGGLFSFSPLERIVVLLSDNAEYRGIDPALLKELTDYYQDALFDAVKNGYLVVTEPGPGVFRGKWEYTKDAFDFWSKRFRERQDDDREVK